MFIRRLVTFHCVLIGIVFAGSGDISATTVTNTNDSGPGSLRQAIADTPTGGTVNFALPNCPCAIVLTSGHLLVDKDLTIAGPGADTLTLSGNNLSRIFFLGHIGGGPQRTISLEGIKISNGRLPSPTPVQFQNDGAGILAINVLLTIRNSVVSDNFTMSGRGGGVTILDGSATIIGTSISNNTAGRYGTFDAGIGGGIANVESALTVIDSVISDNQTSSAGGGIYSNFFATNRIVNSTIFRNRGYASAVYVFQYSSLDIVHCTIEANVGPSVIEYLVSTGNISNSTISGNTSSHGALRNLNVDLEPGKVIHALVTIADTTITNNNGVFQGGISTSASLAFPATTVVRNSIVAGNIPSPDVVGFESGKFVSEGYNLIGDAGILSAVFNEPGDQTGTTGSPIDPRLEPLANYGGPTRTHALKLNSPAADKGKAFGSTVDQRGSSRPNDNSDVPNAPGGDGSDIGAFEVQFPVSGSVTIGGRVIFSGGVARTRGYLTLTDSSGFVRYAGINPFGYYRFIDVPVGRSFTLRLRNKGWDVVPQNIFVAEAMSNLDLVANRSP